MHGYINACFILKICKCNFIQKDDVNRAHPTMWIYALKIRVISYFDFAQTFSSFM